MTRQAVEAKQLDGIETEVAEGVRVLPLSRDDADAEEFSLVAVPDEPGEFALPEGRAADVLVLEGEVALDDGTAVPAGSYAFVAARAGTRRRLRHRAGARYFVGTEGRDANAQAEDQVTDPATVPWDVRVQENCEHTLGGRSIGVVKFLRVDPASKTTVGIGAVWPESGLDCAEYHEQLDEVLNLRGDLLMRHPDGSPAIADGLSYCWRPSNAIHLPKYSYGGSLNFFRNMRVLWSEHGAATFVPVPEWPRMVEEYRDSRRTGAAS